MTTRSVTQRPNSVSMGATGSRPEQILHLHVTQAHAIGGVDEFAHARHQPDAQAVWFGGFDDVADLLGGAEGIA